MNNNVKEAIEFVTKSSNWPQYGYMTLDRCRHDYQFYLGYGRRQDKFLYMGNPQDQIDFMRALYDKLDDKPEWLTLEQINEFEKRMIKQD